MSNISLCFWNTTDVEPLGWSTCTSATNRLKNKQNAVRLAYAHHNVIRTAKEITMSGKKQTPQNVHTQMEWHEWKNKYNTHASLLFACACVVYANGHLCLFWWALTPSKTRGATYRRNRKLCGIHICFWHKWIRKKKASVDGKRWANTPSVCTFFFIVIIATDRTS